MNDRTGGTHPDDCGCCAGLRDAAPRAVSNPPGQPFVGYGLGLHGEIKGRLLARLSRAERPSLRGLLTRDDDDFTTAFLDAAAMVLHILGFYRERAVNEAFLRTATERRSVLELARLIGYELRPGVAAGTDLAFTVESAAGSPQRVPIPMGTKVQSVPGPGELALTYETIEAIEARAAWNEIRPRLTDRHPLPYQTNVLLFEGVATGIKLGDGVLYKNPGGVAAFGLVSALALEPTEDAPPAPWSPASIPPPPGRTRVVLRLLGTPLHDAAPATHPPPPALGPLAATYVDQTKEATALRAEAAAAPGDAWDEDDLFEQLTAGRQPPPTALVFRTRAAVFGHNAPPLGSLPAAMRGQEPEYEIKAGKVEVTALVSGPYATRSTTWADADLKTYLNYRDKVPSSTATDVYLDTVYPAVAPGSIAVLRSGAQWGAYGVKDVSELSHAEFALTARVTMLSLDANTGFSSFPIPKTTVFAQPEALPLARVPVAEAFPPAAGSPVRLEGWVAGLQPGQRVVVGGEREDAPGSIGRESAVLTSVVYALGREGGTEVTFDPPLTHRYRRVTVTINANIAPATHGESVEEVLGSGDAGRPYQRFTLRQPPLTYISAPTPSGTRSTLRVYVNDLLWTEVPTLFGHAPDERVYATRLDDDGRTTVEFGGPAARPATGQENVFARYRKGVGAAGAVAAGRLTTLFNQPLGVRGVTNPRPAEGGDDPERLDSARENAPLTIMTLDRIVSLRDYEDFARAFAGIAKARATWMRAGVDRGVLVSVAGPRGKKIEDSGPDSVYRTLLKAMRAAGDPTVPVRLASYRAKLFRVLPRIKIDPAHRSEMVKAAVQQALRAAFSFEARAFGQPVTLGEVIAVVQRVPGVIAVDIDQLYSGTAGTRLEPPITAAMPRPGATGIEDTELVMLDPAPFTVEEMP